MFQWCGVAEPPQTDSASLQESMAAEAVRLANEGDTEAARDILWGFVHAASLAGDGDWPSQLPRAWVQYLADAFRQILDEQTDPARALHLKASKAGRPVGAKTHDEVRLGAAYWLLRRRSHRPEAAKQILQSAVGADRRTVERAADTCSAFDDPLVIDDALLVAIIAEQPELARAIAAA